MCREQFDESLYEKNFQIYDARRQKPKDYREAWAMQDQRDKKPCFKMQHGVEHRNDAKKKTR